MNQESTLPTRKVGSGALAGAVTVIAVWIIDLFGVEVPPEVASAITLILMFVTSYFVRDSSSGEPVSET
jgi:putative flippase GtrA